MSFLLQFISDNIKYDGTYVAACKADADMEMPCTTPEEACSSQPALVSFFLRAHHNVDANIKPCKPLWTLEQSTDAYAADPNFCASFMSNGFDDLCRSVDDDTHCVDVDTMLPCGEIVPRA